MTVDNWWWTEVAIARFQSLQRKNPAKERLISVSFDESKAKTCKKCQENRGFIANFSYFKLYRCPSKFTKICCRAQVLSACMPLYTFILHKLGTKIVWGNLRLIVVFDGMALFFSLTYLQRNNWASVRLIFVYLVRTLFFLCSPYLNDPRVICDVDN